MDGFDLTFGVQHLVELRHRLLLVDLISFQDLVQRFSRILKLPLKLIEARRGFLDFAAHECLLRVRQRQLALMLHDQVRREHDVA